MSQQTNTASGGGLSPWALALRSELASAAMRPAARMTAAGATIEVCEGRDSLWVLVRREGRGGFALRTAYAPGGPLDVARVTDGDGAAFRVETALGEYVVRLARPDRDRPLLRCTVTLTPAADLRLPFWPRDLYPLDAHGDPVAARGVVHAAQRGLNTGLVYLSLEAPQFGSALYFQNLTALNDYFEAAGTTPDGRVGGEWPELGWQPPPGDRPLPPGKAVVLSDAFLHWSDEVPQEPRQAARLYLDLLAGVYRHLDRPASEYHDWLQRAKETLRDLERAPEATVKHYGHLYLHPYTDAEYPDSMVQLTTLLPIREFQTWAGKPIPLADALRAGVKRFFDPELGTLRRYLPNVGADKDADEVDSWYLYHPLANLGRLALEGDAEARELFLRSLEFGIKVARHFHYLWPVQFKIGTLEVVTGPRKPGEPGQSDTGGLYAYALLQAHELTGDERYVKEAKAAIKAIAEMLFELEYQANITAWGATACLRLWRVTGDEFFRDQSYVFLASFFHNSLVWESRIGNAKHYPIFLGVTCLHDGPYMALYECFEAFASFHEYLAWGGADLPPSVRLLLTEYCKYTPSRAWYYYPKELPEDALATEPRNGRIDRRLAFPLEDLYADGQPAGQVGQEIYGCGAAFAFTTRSYHRLKDAPFLLFCEYPVFALSGADDRCVEFDVRGDDDFTCRARLIPTGRGPLPRVAARDEAGAVLPGRLTDEGHWEFAVRGGSRVEVRWDKDHRSEENVGRE